MTTHSAPRRPLAAGERAAGPAAHAPSQRHGLHAKAWWPWLKRIVTLAFFGLVGYYSFRYARQVDWGDVWNNMLDTPADVLLVAVALVATSFGIYCSFDLLGRRYTGHRLPRSKVWQVNFISYAFNLNMGSIVGAVAFRYRLYGRLGLSVPTITHVMSLSILTNWLGYLLLGSVLFAITPMELPPEWQTSSDNLRWIGLVMLAAASAYLLACLFSKKRTLYLRGQELILPPPRFALLQVAMSVTNWMVMGGILFILLRGEADYAAVLSVLLVAAVAGVITHVPAGLGVLEAVFIALLSHRIPEDQLLAGLLTYRAIYYIGPLLIAAALYLVVEARARKTRHAVRGA